MSDEVATRVLGVDRDVAQCDAHGADAEVLRVDELEESDDDGPPEITLDALSSDTLAALKAHLAVKDATQAFSSLTTTLERVVPLCSFAANVVPQSMLRLPCSVPWVMQAEEGGDFGQVAGPVPGSDGLVSEDFGLSQFWYDDETQRVLAREVLEGAAGGKAAVISAPSVMNGIKLLRETGWSPSYGRAATVYIMEYDRRFDKAYPEAYVYYDYNEPTAVPDELRGSVDYILMDPPYLGTECVGKFMETAEILARRPTAAGRDAEPPTPLMFITSPLNHAFLRERGGLRRTPYKLGFKSKFATPMALYTNYLSDDLGGWVEEEQEQEQEEEEKDGT